MVEVRWSPRAARELERICDVIAQDSERASERFAQRVIEATDRLTNFPHLGRIVPEFRRDDFREIIVQNYRVVYRLLPGAVEIGTIQHGARLLDFPFPDDEPHSG